MIPAHNDSVRGESVAPPPSQAPFDKLRANGFIVPFVVSDPVRGELVEPQAPSIVPRQTLAAIS